MYSPQSHSLGPSRDCLYKRGGASDISRCGARGDMGSVVSRGGGGSGTPSHGARDFNSLVGGGDLHSVFFKKILYLYCSAIFAGRAGPRRREDVCIF